MNQVPKYVWIFLSLFLAVISLQSLGWLRQSESKGQVSVSGTGEVSAVPDIAEITLTIQTESKTARDTQNLSATKSKALQAFCEQEGISKKDLKTSQYRLEPVYFYVVNKAPQLSGFRLTQSLKVTVRDLDQIGDIIAGGVQAGANQVDGPYFSVDRRDELVQTAREKAFTHAKELARLQAQSAGVRLGKVIGFSENSAGIPYATAMLSMEKRALRDTSAVPDIEAGSDKITVTVNLVYELE